MSKKFDPDQIEGASKDVRKVAERLDDEIDAILDETKAIGKPCGDSEPIGMLLGVSYAAAEEVLVEALHSVVVGFEGHSEKLKTMAVRDAETEQANNEGMKHINGVL